MKISNGYFSEMHLQQNRKLKTFLWSLQCRFTDILISLNLQTALTGENSVKNDLTSAILGANPNCHFLVVDKLWHKTTSSVSPLPWSYHPLGIKSFTILFRHRASPLLISCVPCNCFQCENRWHTQICAEFQSASTASPNLSSIKPYYYIYTRSSIFV